MAERPRFEILDHADTPLGPLCLRRRELISSPGTIVVEVTLDGEFLMSSLNTTSERALARHALAFHPGSDLRVLVGGLGLGYTAGEFLESRRIARLEVVELLPQVISWLERGLVPLAASLSAEPRLRVLEGDIYRRLREPPLETYDVIAIDVDHNPEEVLHDDHRRFYGAAGIRSAREHLAPGGVLAVWSSAENEAFAGALERAFPQVRVEPVPWRNDLLDEDPTDILFLARRDG